MAVVINGTTGVSGVDGSAGTPSYQGTDSNTGIFFPAADTIAFGEGGAEAMRIDSSGNVGIGTSSPSYKLSIQTAAASNNFIQFSAATGDSVAGSLIGRPGNTDLRIQNSENASIIFMTNNTERMRINAGAPILCLSGGNTSATGTGIAFPATQSASTDANTLDDYEEGTWTPTITFGGGSTGLTFASRTGRYVKIGKMVYAGFTFSLSNKGSSTGGSVIGGLPFSSGSTDGAQRYSGACGYYDNFTGIGMVQLLMESGSSSSALRYATATASTAITDANFTNSSGMHGIFIYETD